MNPGIGNAKAGIIGRLSHTLASCVADEEDEWLSRATDLIDTDVQG
jgi:hypothetical protein